MTVSDLTGYSACSSPLRRSPVACLLKPILQAVRSGHRIRRCTDGYSEVSVRISRRVAISSPTFSRVDGVLTESLDERCRTRFQVESLSHHGLRGS